MQMTYKQTARNETHAEEEEDEEETSSDAHS